MVSKMKSKARKCFAKNCSSKSNQSFNGKRLRLFRVPEGIEGFFWAKAVNNWRANLNHYIDLLSSSTSGKANRNSQQTNNKQKNILQHCCELHFNVSRPCCLSCAPSTI